MSGGDARVTFSLPPTGNEPQRDPVSPSASDRLSDGQLADHQRAQGEPSLSVEVAAPGLQPAPGNRPAGKPGRSGPPRNQNARTHGGSRAALELKELVRRSMDGRTTEAREVADWIGDYAGDLGGIDDLTTGQRTMLQLAAQTWLQLRRIDAFIAGMQSIAHAKRRQLYPIIVQRAGLVNTLRGLLSDLGLQRKARDVGNLTAYLAAKATQQPPAADAAQPAAVADSPIPAEVSRES